MFTVEGRVWANPLVAINIRKIAVPARFMTVSGGQTAGQLMSSRGFNEN
jgi:hypothetical protein